MMYPAAAAARGLIFNQSLSVRRPYLNIHVYDIHKVHKI